MFFYLLLLFTMVPVVELALLIKVGGMLGVMPTIGIVLFTGVLGAYLARLQGFILLQNMQRELNEGRMPAEGLFDGLIILCSGLLLLTPGFMTDILGFAGLTPAFRTLMKRWIKQKIAAAMSDGRVITITPFRSHY